MMTTVVLKRLSICSCGFTALHDHIPLGKTYEVISEGPGPRIFHGYSWRCGGCGVNSPTPMVKATQDGTLGVLPAGLFEEVQ